MSARLVGIFSPIEVKSAVSTICIDEHFGKEWGKKTYRDGGQWVFRGALIAQPLAKCNFFGRTELTNIKISCRLIGNVTKMMHKYAIILLVR